MKGTPLTDETFQYIVENFAKPERELLEAMSARAQEAGVPMIMISEDQAKFVAFFVKAIKARRVLDVGTLFGYSAAIMSRAMGPSGEVVSLEFSELHADVAKKNLEAIGVKNVDVRVGSAVDTMKTLESDSFDFILIDADKPNYPQYLKESLRLIRNGGVIAGDNALAWGKIASPKLTESDPDYISTMGMRAFNAAVAKEKSMFSIIVPIGDGMAMGVVTK